MAALGAGLSLSGRRASQAATIAPEMLCHSENTAEGSAASGAEVCGGQGGGQPGVLHAHLERQRPACLVVQPAELPGEVAEAQAETVVEDNGQENDAACGHDLAGAAGHHDRDDQGNHDGGCPGECRKHLRDELLEEEAGQQAGDHRQQHGLDDVHHHGAGVDVEEGPGQEQDQQRGDDGSDQRGDRGDGHGERNVPLGQERHHVGGGAGRCAAHEDQADGQFRRELRSTAISQPAPGMIT